MALVRAISMKDFNRRATTMTIEELGRRRRPPKRSRVAGRPRRHRPPKHSSMAGAPRRKPWSRSAKLGDNIEIRAKAPYRAASMEIRPGLYVVGELQGGDLDFGAGVDLSKHLVNAASAGIKAISSKSKKRKKRRNAYVQRLILLQQREQALVARAQKLQRREQRLQRFEEWLKRVLPTGAGDPSLAPSDRKVVPWMAGVDDIGDDEPYNLARLMAQWHEDDE